MINKIVFSGGGINGIIFLGVVKYLEENDLLKNINTFIGTSFGSLISALLCLNYSYSELNEFLLSFNLIDLQHYDINNLFTNYGIDSGINIQIILKCFIRNKLEVDDITLKELYYKTKKKIVIVTTCLTNNKEYALDYITHPNLSLIKALQMSMCIPIYFEPILYENKLFIDGSVLSHFYINYLKKNDNSVLGILLFNDSIFKINEINNFEDYIYNLIEILLNNITIDCTTDKRIIKIKYEYSCLHFNISLNEKINLVKIGYNNAYDYFKKNN